MAAPSHFAYSDETHYNVGRYRGIGLVTVQHASAVNSNVELRRLLDESEVREFKWRKFDSAKERFAACKMLEFALAQVGLASMRLDILVWDTEDSRHKIRGRDDTGNLHRMYHHLFKHVLSERWPDGSTWCLYPDEQGEMDWDSVEGFLDKVSSRAEISRDLFSGERFRLRLKREFRIEEVVPVSSEKEPLVQLADLLAGLAVYSREAYERYELWQASTSSQQLLFDPANKSELAISRADHERFAALAWFDAECKKRKFGVSLKTYRGLRTPNPDNPINFWWYEPQHDQDKAPVKSRP